MVDVGNVVQYFYETDCCTHVFVGKQEADGSVNGKMFRRDLTGCRTEYNVAIHRQPGTVSELKLNYGLAAVACAVNNVDPLRTLRRVG